MRYLPHTSEDIESMLQVVGVDSLEDLFDSVPSDCLAEKELDIPGPLTEWDLNKHMDALAAPQATSSSYNMFMGAGSYDHNIPSLIPYLLSRSEFATAYTPYQPEISQGTLQGIYEFQTLTARLLGMDIATASHYDGATALAEALFIGTAKTKKNKVAISSLVHPLQREVVETYFSPTDYEIIELPFLEDGKTDLSAIDSMDDVAAVAIQSPNFFGVIENLAEAAEKAHGVKALFITSFNEALAYGLLKNPGSQGADLAVGDGQSLGIPRSFGGPGIGLFSSTKKYMRNLPGRLVGKTLDVDGKNGFVLTLATREQHIRREKATSNICSNNGLCAMAAGMYMAALGGTGIRELAQLNHDKAQYLKKQLENAGFDIPFKSPFFNEFLVNFGTGFDKKYEKLVDKKIIPGVPVAKYYPQLADHYLLCATETATKEDMDRLVKELKS